MLLELALLSASAAVAVGLWALAVVSGVVRPSGTHVLAILWSSDALLLLLKQVAGAEVPHLLTMLGALGLIVLPVSLRYPSRLKEVLRQPPLWLWVLFAAIGAASLSWSPVPEYGRTKLQIMLLGGLLPGVAAAVATRRDAPLSWTPVLVAGALYSVVALALGATLGSDDRLMVGDTNPIWVARTALLAVTVALWSGHGPWVLRLGVIALGAWIAVRSGSRGPLVAFVTAPGLVGLVLLAGRMPHLRRAGAIGRHWPTAAAAAMVLLAAGALLVTPIVEERSADNRLLRLLAPSTLAADESALGRQVLLEGAIASFAEQPGFGVGLGGTAQSEALRYPHNLPLEVASETGVLGLVVWMAAVAYGLSAARGHTLVQVLLLQVLLYSLFSGDLGGNGTVVTLAVFALALRSNAAGADVVRRFGPAVRGPIPVGPAAAPAGGSR